MICWRKVLYSYCTTTERSATTRDVSPASLTLKKFDKTPRPTPEYFSLALYLLLLLPGPHFRPFCLLLSSPRVPFLLLLGDSYSSPLLYLLPSTSACARLKSLALVPRTFLFRSTRRQVLSVCIFKSLLLLAAFANEEEEKHFFSLLKLSNAFCARFPVVSTSPLEISSQTRVNRAIERTITPRFGLALAIDSMIAFSSSSASSAVVLFFHRGGARHQRRKLSLQHHQHRGSGGGVLVVRSIPFSSFFFFFFFCFRTRIVVFGFRHRFASSFMSSLDVLNFEWSRVCPS